MLNKLIKWFLFLLCLGWSVQQFITGNIGNGIALFLLCVVIAGTYLRHEYMLMALYQLRKKNVIQAKKYLVRIKTPEKTLIRPQIGYYYFLRALTEAEQNINLCEKYMYRSLDKGLRMKHDKALAHLNLAMISIRKRLKRKAINHLSKAKKFDTSKMFSEQIRMVNHNIKRS